MVFYVIICRFLQEIPPSISFRSARLLAWLYAKGVHLRNVQTPAPETWCTLPNDYPADTTLFSDPYGITASSEKLSVVQDSKMGRCLDD